MRSRKNQYTISRREVHGRAAAVVQRVAWGLEPGRPLARKRSGETVALSESLLSLHDPGSRTGATRYALIIGHYPHPTHPRVVPRNPMAVA